jgi:hypothetical protein
MCETIRILDMTKVSDDVPTLIMPPGVDECHAFMTQESGIYYKIGLGVLTR